MSAFFQKTGFYFFCCLAFCCLSIPVFETVDLATLCVPGPDELYVELGAHRLRRSPFHMKIALEAWQTTLCAVQNLNYIFIHLNFFKKENTVYK